MEIKTLLITFFIVISLVFSPLAFSKNSLTENLIAINSEKGQAIFAKSDKQAFWQLMPYAVMQKNLLYCGVASAVMVLNASNIPAPLTPELAPNTMFNQHNFFTKDVLALTTPSKVGQFGMEFQTLNDALASFDGIQTEMVYASDVTQDEFRHHLSELMKMENTYVIGFYDNALLGQDGSGHFSPITAYNGEQDRFLILDTARYNNPPFWVTTQMLYKSMTIGLADLPRRAMGYLVISVTSKD